jgi:hypothetical protein
MLPSVGCFRNYGAHIMFRRLGCVCRKVFHSCVYCSCMHGICGIFLMSSCVCLSGLCWFQDTRLKIAYWTNNTIRKHLFKKHEILDKYDNSGIYAIKCLDCPRQYIGQTRRPFKTRYKEHIILDCDVTYGIPKEHDVRIQKLDIVLQTSTHIVDHP